MCARARIRVCTGTYITFYIECDGYASIQVTLPVCVCEYSTDAVKYSCHRPSLSGPPPLFFILARSMGKKQTGQHLFRAHDGLFFFFFFSTFYDICCLHVGMCMYVCMYAYFVCVAELFLNIVIIFCRFFFFRGKGKEMVSPERRANFHEGSCMDSLREGLDGTMRILSSAGCLIAEGRDANGFKLINESYTVYNMYIRIFKRFIRTVNNKRTIKYNELVTSN